MTTVVANPLHAAWLDLCEPSHGLGAYDYKDERRWYEDESRDPSTFPSSNQRRKDLCSQYAFAIPTPGVIARIAQWSPIVECGAGTGYWASLLAAEGADVLAYDLRPPGHPKHEWAMTASYYPVRRLSAAAAARRYPERTLMLCWPPYGDPMAYDALSAYAHAGGRRLVYIGETESGCTGDNVFHAVLEDPWEDDDLAPWRLVDHLDIPQWPGIRDACYLYERRL